MIFIEKELTRLRKISMAAHKRLLATGLSGVCLTSETLEQATLDQLDDAAAADAACKAADQAVEAYLVRRL